MIVYASTKEEFLKAGRGTGKNIEDLILEDYKAKLGKGVSSHEYRSWQASLGQMQNLLYDYRIPDKAGIVIEYQLPYSGLRVDFMITGRDQADQDNVVVIELKQWECISLTQKDAVVETFLAGRLRELNHPSYQAWSYCAYLSEFNEEVYKGNINLSPCAYLHNYLHHDGIIDNLAFKPYTDKAPVFIKDDKEKLISYISRYICKGDLGQVMYRVEHSRIKPSKQLADSLVSMLKDNREFILLDDQKIAYEAALSIARSATKKRKKVLVIKGGPGTGKSVIAINLLVALNKQRHLVKYVTRNSAPRAVYSQLLKGNIKKKSIDFLFSGSGCFTDIPENFYKALIVDEAHRLTRLSGLYSRGENQIKEIIRSAQAPIFFLDEDQKVTFKDIGTYEEIAFWASSFGAEVEFIELKAQFRCNGSNAYIAWLDQMLQIRETENKDLNVSDFDFRIVDNPKELEAIINEQNQNNKARMVAGYCWDWVSKNDLSRNDIVFPEFGFAHKWNLFNDGPSWMIRPDSVTEIGCIHTCQGLELESVGVIVGEDLVVRDGKVITRAAKRARTDKSLSGYKKMLKEDPDQAERIKDQIIKNTYRTLFTRGQKHCYVYFVDPETKAYFKKHLKSE